MKLDQYRVCSPIATIRRQGRKPFGMRQCTHEIQCFRKSVIFPIFILTFGPVPGQYFGLRSDTDVQLCLPLSSVLSLKKKYLCGTSINRLNVDDEI